MITIYVDYLPYIHKKRVLRCGAGSGELRKHWREELGHIACGGVVLLDKIMRQSNRSDREIRGRS